MSTTNQPIGANDFILQESPTSRDTITVAKGVKLAAGAVVMQASDGRYQPIDMRLRTKARDSGSSQRMSMSTSMSSTALAPNTPKPSPNRNRKLGGING